MRRIGLLSISDERERVHERLCPFIEEHTRRIAQVLAASGEVVVLPGGPPIHSPREACEQGRRLAAAGAEGVIFSLPTFGFPRLGVLAAQFAPGPYLLVTTPNPEQPTPAGFLGLGGAMTQLGIMHERLWDDPASEAGRTVILRFIRAASVVNKLRGQVLGVFGGRSMGLYPMTASGSEIMRLFGVDVDHVDQLEIVRLAANVPEAKVQTAFQWLKNHVRNISFGNVLTQARLYNQIRHFEATKELIRQRQMDFVAIKCHYEMSEYQVPQCLSTAFLNDPYDWDGPRDPIIAACEADHDGALTMRLLNLLTDKPACLLDLRYFDAEKGVYILQNCGSTPTWFALHSDDAAENLRNVTLCPCVSKFGGGGAHVRCNFREGDYTLARLYHTPEGYSMTIMEAEAIPSQETPLGADPNWPLAVMRLESEPQRIRDKLQVVHLHAVPGRHADALNSLCRFLNVRADPL